jgi:hypothetical protein
MKMFDKAIQPMAAEYVVIPRGETSYTFKLIPVLDFQEFDKILPRPEPPEILKPGGVRFRDTQNPDFVKRVSDWALKRTSWLIIRSLSGTDGLSWETVKLSDPDTWPLYNDELKASGLTDLEIGKLVEAIWNVCGLNERRIEQATKDFLATLVLSNE